MCNSTLHWPRQVFGPFVSLFGCSHSNLKIPLINCQYIFNIANFHIDVSVVVYLFQFQYGIKSLQPSENKNNVFGISYDKV